MVLRYSTFVLLVACSCAPAPVARVDPALLPSRAALTALVFFSADCHCFAAHDARLVALAGRYAGRGVDFLVVDSEVGADASRDDAEAARRGYPFRIVVDRGAKLAAQAHAVYATYSVLLDAQGRVLYQGGIDSDKDRLHDDATPYLADAIDDALAGKPLRRAEAKALGCALRTW
ncbi:MAG TPA: hypothetical protein VIF09_18810 [Polyangiaceae bacterium]|jgi:hypothetical protein